MIDQRERDIAIMEGELNAAEDAYFDARPAADNGHNRHIFREGFCRAWNIKAQPPADDQARRDAVPETKRRAPDSLLGPAVASWLKRRHANPFRSAPTESTRFDFIDGYDAGYRDAQAASAAEGGGDA